MNGQSALKDDKLAYNKRRPNAIEIRLLIGAALDNSETHENALLFNPKINP